MNKQEMLNVMARQESFVKAGNEIYAMHCDGSIPYVESGFDLGESTFGPFVGDGNFRISEREWRAARDEYLAKQEPQWNGEGLPPVEVECEAMLNGRWQKCEILKTKVNSSEMEVAACDFGKAGLAWSADFRPLRTDRDKAIEFLLDPGDPCGYSYVECRDDAEAIIDALDAGEIPGYGKLEK